MATKGKRRTRRVVDSLKPEQLDALIRGCNARCPTGCRNRALLLLAAGAGLRVSEIVALMPNDIDWSGNQVTIRHGKGDVDRVVAVHDRALDAMRAWDAKRTALGYGARAPFFNGLKSRGGPLPPRYLQALVARLGDKAGIPRRKRTIKGLGEIDAGAHFHQLRHSFASHALAGKWIFEARPWTILEVSQQLGHARLQTTSIYLHSDATARVARIRPPEADPAASLVAVIRALPADARLALQTALAGWGGGMA